MVNNRAPCRHATISIFSLMRKTRNQLVSSRDGVNLTPDILADGGATAPGGATASDGATAPGRAVQTQSSGTQPVPDPTSSAPAPTGDQSEIMVLRDTVLQLTTKMRAWEEASGGHAPDNARQIIVAAKDIPTLKDLSEESINLYEIAVRSWTNSGRVLSDRVAVTDKLAMDITMAWELDPKMKEMGSWKNAREVSEEVFISFLRSMQKRNQRMASHLTNFSNFLIQNPLRFFLEDEASLWVPVSEYRLEWEKIPSDQITETWERD